MTDRPESTVVITGAGSGIGLRAARQFAERGHRVFALCRDRSRGGEALARINATARRPARLVLADMADLDDLDAAADVVARHADHVDVVIHNAANFDQSLRRPRYTAAGHELIWATNHLGPFRLTAALSALLAAAPRPKVVTVASKGLITTPRIRIRFDSLDGTGWYSPTRAYYHSKLAQVMFSLELAARTAGRVVVTCVRVPAVRLDADRVAALPRLSRVLYAPKNRLAASPEDLAATYVRIAEDESDWPVRVELVASSGTARGAYVDEHRRPVGLPAFARDPAARARLWTVTEVATGNPSWAW